MSSYKYGVYGFVVFLTVVFILMWTNSQKPLSFIPVSQLLTNYFHRDDVRNETFQSSIVPFSVLKPEPVKKSDSKNIKTEDHRNFRRIPDVSSLHARFAPLTRNSCNNTCLSNDFKCKAETRKAWLQIIEKGALVGVPLFSENEYFFSWELEYLKTPPLSDIKTLPSLNLSDVYVFPKDRMKGIKRPNSSVNSERTVIILARNVPATFRVDLYDSHNQSRANGGDEVRAWLTGRTNGPSPENMSATAQVKDLGNGSYDVIATPTWSGTAKLNVAATYPLEYIRTTVHHFRLGSHRFVFGKFKRGDVEEVTLCHSAPNVPGRHCVCNMTKVNTLLYYCGRPLHPSLSCDDWKMANSVSKPGFNLMTAAEVIMDKHISRPPNNSLIHHNIDIKITEGNKAPLIPSCRNASRRKSWTMTSPRGVWSRDKTVWNSLVCREPDMTSKWVHSCLNSSTVWLLGDSNVRNMAYHLSHMLGCDFARPSRWPSTDVCKNEKHNITVHFRPHEYPLYVDYRWVSLLENGPVTDTLSSIPSTGDHIVIFHYFLHFSSSHLHVLQNRLDLLKTAISKLLSRNPRILVVVWGPHTSAVEWGTNHMYGGDVLGTFIRQLYIDVFRDLQDSVVFLDGWDMSISFENLEFHPPGVFTRSLLRTILAYRCD